MSSSDSGGGVRRWVRTLPLLLVAALVLGGCTRQEAEIVANEQVPAEDRTQAEPADADVGEETPSIPTWVAVDIAYESAPSELPAGESAVELINQGAAQHNVVIDDLGSEPIMQADPGETVQGTVSLEPGEYRYHCSIPGHETLMNGTVIVS
jgi:plastocyanin